uniref:Uncharacterized protein n=1 Tax=Medicago truncatula TaxID=3880 RepID=A2Q1A0_MEDTR|nr:hypothetical protein MtrDRAFT_AC148396g17v2 [Medicago truncatula]
MDDSDPIAFVKYNSGGGCLVSGFITEWGGSDDPLCRKKKRWGDHALRRTTTVVSASPVFRLASSPSWSPVFLTSVVPRKQ